MQDVGYWEKHGVQSVAVTTTAFLHAAFQQLKDLGLNGVCYACVPHPVQGMSKSEVVVQVNILFPQLLRALQEDSYASPSPASVGTSSSLDCGS